MGKPVNINMNGRVKACVCELIQNSLKIKVLSILESTDILQDEEGFSMLKDYLANYNFDIRFFAEDKQEALIDIANKVINDECKTTNSFCSLQEIAYYVEDLVFEAKREGGKFKDKLPLNPFLEERVRKFNETYYSK